MYRVKSDPPEFREMVDHRTWCPTNDRARWVRTTSWDDTCRWVFTFSVEVGREDRGFHARIGIPLVGREERSDVVQPVGGTRGGWNDRVFDFSGLSLDIREEKRWLGGMAYNISKRVVNRGGIILKYDSCHVDYAFPFTCKYDVRREGDREQQPKYG
jgi:hypothetical protein